MIRSIYPAWNWCWASLVLQTGPPFPHVMRSCPLLRRRAVDLSISTVQRSSRLTIHRELNDCGLLCDLCLCDRHGRSRQRPPLGDGQRTHNCISKAYDIPINYGMVRMTGLTSSMDWDSYSAVSQGLGIERCVLNLTDVLTSFTRFALIKARPTPSVVYRLDEGHATRSNLPQTAGMEWCDLVASIYESARRLEFLGVWIKARPKISQSTIRLQDDPARDYAI